MDEGDDDNGGAAGPAEGAPAPPTSSTTHPARPQLPLRLTSSAGATAASTAGAAASTGASASTGAVATDDGQFSHRILRDRNSQRIGEALWSGRYAWGMALEWLPEDGRDPVDPSTAFNDGGLADEGPAADDRPEMVEERRGQGQLRMWSTTQRNQPCRSEGSQQIPSTRCSHGMDMGRPHYGQANHNTP